MPFDQKCIVEDLSVMIFSSRSFPFPFLCFFMSWSVLLRYLFMYHQYFVFVSRLSCFGAFQCGIVFLPVSLHSRVGQHEWVVSITQILRIKLSFCLLPVNSSKCELCSTFFIVFSAFQRLHCCWFDLLFALSFEHFQNWLHTSMTSQQIDVLVCTPRKVQAKENLISFHRSRCGRTHTHSSIANFILYKICIYSFSFGCVRILFNWRCVQCTAGAEGISEKRAVEIVEWKICESHKLNKLRVYFLFREIQSNIKINMEIARKAV